MNEISAARPLPPSQPSSRPQQSAEQVLKLLQPLEGVLGKGDSASAEVLSVREVAAQNFQVLLRLTLAGGAQATLQASSGQPLAQGSQLDVTALSDSRMLISLRSDGQPLLNRLDLQLLPKGSLIQGKVEAREPLEQGYRITLRLLNSPLAGSRLALDSDSPLPVGSLLSARVQSSQSLLLQPLGERIEQLALNQHLQTQAGRQGSLEALFGLLATSAGKPLPETLRLSIDRLLGSLPDLAQLSDAKGLAKAVADAGILLEARLLGSASGLQQDLKANLLRLIAQIAPQLPAAAASSASTAGTLAQALPAFARGLLDGLAGTRQYAPGFPLPSAPRQILREDGEVDLELMLKLAAAAVSRLQTHQLSSLAQTQVNPDGSLLTTWQLELPMRQQQELLPLQLKIEREQQARQEQQTPQETLWRIELAFDLPPLGPLQVQAQLAQGRLSSQLWAEREHTASLIRGELGHLRQRLLDAGLQVGELECRRGTPPRGPRTHIEQRWIDETA